LAKDGESERPKGKFCEHLFISTGFAQQRILYSLNALNGRQLALLKIANIVREVVGRVSILQVLLCHIPQNGYPNDSA